MCSQTALPVRQTSTLERDTRINHIPAAKSSFHWWQAKSGRTQTQHGPHRAHPKTAEGGQKLCTPQRVMHVVLYRSCSHFFCVLLVLEDLNVPAGTTHNTQLCGLLSYALFWATTTCCKMVRFCPRVHNTTNEVYISTTATHGVQKGVVGRHIRHGCMVTGCHALFGPNSDCEVEVHLSGVQDRYPLTVGLNLYSVPNLGPGKTK